jgi:NAD-dependent deacetylase
LNIINNEKVNLVAELIKESKYTVVLTGAGVSTGSGIADFRTPGKGIWEKVDPFKVTSITAFEENPQRFYHFYRPRIEILSRVSPNPAHKAITCIKRQAREKSLKFMGL